MSPPGTLKTPNLKSILAPVSHYQVVLKEQFDEAMRGYKVALTEYEKAVFQYKKDKGGYADPPEKPEKPIMKRIMTADITVERLGTLLGENPRGLLLSRDELTAWVKSLNQYKGGKGADRQFYLTVWSGGAFTIDRQGKDPIFVDDPALSVVGNIPPTVLPALNDESDREDGFIHRILFAYPNPVPVRWTDAVVSEVTRTGYEHLIQSLYALTFERDAEGRRTPKVLSLTIEAQALFNEWHDDHCADAERPDLPGGLRGFYFKLKGYCARLALIHALCTNPAAVVVEKESIGAACDLTEYFKAQAKKILPLLVRKKLTPHERCEGEIIRNLAGGKVETPRNLQRNGNAPAVVFNEVLEALLKAGRVEWVEISSNRGPRKGVRLTETQDG